jgi:hypothetical protein
VEQVGLATPDDVVETVTLRVMAAVDELALAI